MQVYDEYDNASAKRKYQNGIIYGYTHAPTGLKLESVYVHLIDKTAIPTVYSVEGFKEVSAGVYDNVVFKYSPVYKRIEPGYYPTSEDSVAFIRRNVGYGHKNWHVGISKSSFITFNVMPDGVNNQCNPLDNGLILLDKQFSIPQALEAFGAVSRELYLSKERVLFLGKTIGFRNENRLYVQDDYLPEISDIVNTFPKQFNITVNQL